MLGNLMFLFEAMFFLGIRWNNRFLDMDYGYVLFTKR